MVTQDDNDALQPVAARGSKFRRSWLDFINMHDGAIEIKSPIVGHFLLFISHTVYIAHYYSRVLCLFVILPLSH